MNTRDLRAHGKGFFCAPDSPAFPETHIYHWRSSEKKDDGASYEAENVCPRWHGGMTKREYFAAMAMQGYLASPHREITISNSEGLAATCLALADALIEELNK